MKEKFLLTLMVVIFSILTFGAVGVYAANEGIYTYAFSGGMAIIQDCDTSATGEIIIPDKIEGCPVTRIAKDAFYNCNALTSITIPNSVIKIGAGAFSNCSNLEKISIPESVTFIGSGAFYNCNNLKTINISDFKAWFKIEFDHYTSNPLYNGGNLYLNEKKITEFYIPDTITEIKKYVFYNYEDLTSIIIPDNVTDIGEYAFSYCTNLASVVIPGSVKTIEYGAFNNCIELSNVTIGEGVTNIWSAAFENCISLKSITIPSSVKCICSDAFGNCTALTGVYIFDIEAWCDIEFDYSSNPLIYAENLYLNGELVTNITIPDNITALKNYVFENCINLKTVILPDDLTTIGKYTFYNCINLANITIPKNVTKIDDSAFEKCAGITKLTIPNSVTRIGEYAFSDCIGLTNVSIGNGVTSIGCVAFDNCTQLRCVNIVDIASWCNIEFEIGDYSYNNRPSSNPLYYSCNLYLNGSIVTNLTIPNNVIQIKRYAFYNCTSLKNLIIPDNVTNIERYAFALCLELNSVSIGNGITFINDYTFLSCKQLNYICLPKSLGFIQSEAFLSCPKIQIVFYEGNKLQWDNLDYKTNLWDSVIVYKSARRTYRFETNSDTTIPDITNYAVFTAPTVKNDKKTLIGWYDNASLSGEPVTFPYYGNVTTLYAAWTDRTGKSFDDALIAKENKEFTITANEPGQIIYYEFIPKYTGEYRFYSIGDCDTYGYLYSSSKSQIAYDNDAGAGSNFYIERELTAGETYYIGAKVYSGTGTFTLHVETDCIPGTKTVCVTASSGEKIFISIPSYLQENSQVILACYKNDKFVEMETAPNKNETIYFVINHEFDTAKVMVWESFENMKPLCEVEVVQ